MGSSEKYKLDLSLVKKLIKIIESSEVNEIELEEEGVKIKVVKSSKTQEIIQAPIQHSVQVPIHQTIDKVKNVSYEVAATESNKNLHEIKSPIVGTFYRSPSPDSPSFIEVGSLIDSGTPLCIIEAMKLMNEIQSEVKGKILKILVENGKPVEYNQPLFLVEV
ncbi:MAG: acetyl-CoA carboxylase biotin carboxyl carrier protein [Bacteroidetes bacterium]|nr:acetyl-CoA carboxylase biotin carboxyl carrier protein [Bacteroidota bacterium]